MQRAKITLHWLSCQNKTKQNGGEGSGGDNGPRKSRGSNWLQTGLDTGLVI